MLFARSSSGARKGHHSYAFQCIAMASISVSHDESYHLSRDYQLGITILLDKTAYFEHLVPSPTNLVAGGHMTKYWKRRRKLSPQNVSVAINKVMEIVTV